MINEKTDEPKAKETAKDRFQQEFEAMPLEKKIASLFRMEAVTLSETVAYVVNSPMKVVEKVGDVIAEFGMKIENEARKAASSSPPPAAAASAAGEAGEKKGPAKPKQRPARKTPPPASK